jgi:uncharacterized membrane protein
LISINAPQAFAQQRPWSCANAARGTSSAGEAGMSATKPETGTPQRAAPGFTTIAVRAVPFDRPWEWLAAGWRDVWNKPEISLPYGVVAVALGLVLAFGLVMTGFESLIPVVAGGFTIVGPILALGLYEKSRRLAAGAPVTMADTRNAALGAVARIGLFMACLLIIYLVWIRIAFLLLMLFLGTNGLPPAREFMPTLLFTPHGLGLLIVGTAVGAGLASVVFSISAISIPLLMERRVDAFTAMVTSVRAVLASPRALALWAALIAGFVALGIATIGVGLIFAFPLLGHATWHAYRDLIAPDEQD